MVSFLSGVPNVAGLKIAFLDSDGNTMAGQSDNSRPPSSQRTRSNTDFSNHTWVPVPDQGRYQTAQL